MPQNKCIPEDRIPASVEEAEQMLFKMARLGAQRMLQDALEKEVEIYLNGHADKTDENGNRAVVRNGHGPKRNILTGVGSVQIFRPRIDERKAVDNDPAHSRFSSGILPRFLRRTPSVEGVVSVLYLKGISTNDFESSLRAIYGDEAGSLSASTVSRLKEAWYGEYEAWRKQRITASQYAYIWADGVYFNARVEGEKNCILVIIGAKYNGEKELLAISDGVRESEASWKDLLLELKDRGMHSDPKLAVADGGLGFWKALPQVFPTTKQQRCWVHKTANVLDKLPKKMRPRAKTLIHDIYLADTRQNADTAFDHFCDSYRDKYPKAVACLEKDREGLMNFYKFPSSHWKHIRSTNVIESIFATVRLRTYKTKGLGTRTATLAMSFKLIQEAEKRWQKITKWQQLELVREGRKFKDGELVEETAA
jgi:transposase-like protein